MNTNEIASLAQCLDMSDRIGAGQTVVYRSHSITGTVAKARGYGSFEVRNNLGHIVAANVGYICHAVEAADMAHDGFRGGWEGAVTVGEWGIW